MYIFKLDADDQVMGLHCCNHMAFHFPKDDNEFITRRYTPISLSNDKGHVAFVIKTYKKSEEFPEGGKVSQILYDLEPGKKIRMEGPMGLLNYMGFGNFVIRKKPVKKTKIGIIAGGTGLTPCFPIIKASTLA